MRWVVFIRLSVWLGYNPDFEGISKDELLQFPGSSFIHAVGFGLVGACTNDERVNTIPLVLEA